MGFLAGLLAVAKGKALTLLIGSVGAGAALALLGRIVPNLISKFVAGRLDKLLDVTNPIDKELILALVRYAEAKIPDKGQGKEKYDMVAAKLVAIFPTIASQQGKISSLIEEAVSRLNEELKKRS